MVYYFIALPLYMRSSYREVLRCLLEGVQWLLNPVGFGESCRQVRHLAGEKLVPALQKGMLCLGDRFFPSHKLRQTATNTGAELLWRTRQNARLDIDRRLPPAAPISGIYPSTADGWNERNAIVVRVIDYRLDKVPDAEPIYRLITTILDHKLAPPNNWRPYVTSDGECPP